MGQSYSCDCQNNRQYFVLITTTKRSSETAISGYDLALLRATNNYWPLFFKTRNKYRIKSGDLCVLYLAGKGKLGSYFIGEAEITDSQSHHTPHEYRDFERFQQVCDTILSLDNLRILDPPVPIHSIIERLSIIKNKSNWGMVFHGGTVEISKQDFELITSR